MKYSARLSTSPVPTTSPRLRRITTNSRRDLSPDFGLAAAARAAAATCTSQSPTSLQSQQRARGSGSSTSGLTEPLLRQSPTRHVPPPPRCMPPRSSRLPASALNDPPRSSRSPSALLDRAARRHSMLAVPTAPAVMPAPARRPAWRFVPPPSASSAWSAAALGGGNDRTAARPSGAAPGPAVKPGRYSMPGLGVAATKKDDDTRVVASSRRLSETEREKPWSGTTQEAWAAPRVTVTGDHPKPRAQSAVRARSGARIPRACSAGPCRRRSDAGYADVHPDDHAQDRGKEIPTAEVVDPRKEHPIRSVPSLRHPPPCKTLPSAKFGGKYTIGRYLGRGASATVWEASHLQLSMRVAVKAFDQGSKDRREAHRELRVLSKVNHPRILKVYEVVETPAQAHMVSEFVDGESLRAFTQRQPNKCLQEHVARRYYQQVVDGVSYCHEKLIVHRDLKLENLLLDRKLESVKIIDFGFAAQCSSMDAKLKAFCGTPSYMAPEIINGDGYNGFSADVWALGVVLFALLAGSLPFSARTEMQLYRKIQCGIVTVPDSLPEGARRLIKGALRLKPTERWAVGAILRHSWVLGGAHHLVRDDSGRQARCLTTDAEVAAGCGGAVLIDAGGDSAGGPVERSGDRAAGPAATTLSPNRVPGAVTQTRPSPGQIIKPTDDQVRYPMRPLLLNHGGG